jgi:exosortase/archaeosortase family protein
MPNNLSRLQAGVPDRFLATLAVALAFVGFLTVDQMYWWQLKPDYAFGWLVPVFVIYLVYERWPRLQEIFRATGPSPLPGWLHTLCTAVAGLALGGGLLLFLLAALYRAGVGSTQPGSLMLAAGFSGVLLGMIYFNVPAGCVGAIPPAAGARTLRADARLQAAALFLFPALIWMLSAPLVSAVENAISLSLLRQVVSVVFTVFNLLGYPLVQEGNVLMLPRGSVGVADACSGIRSLTGCLFAGSFLAAVFLDRFWQKVLLVALAMGFAFLTNLLRSLFLTAWAYAYGSEAIEGTLHDATGYAVMGLTVVGLLVLLPLFNPANWRRWLALESAAAAEPSH